MDLILGKIGATQIFTKLIRYYRKFVLVRREKEHYLGCVFCRIRRVHMCAIVRSLRLCVGDDHKGESLFFFLLI